MWFRAATVVSLTSAVILLFVGLNAEVPKRPLQPALIYTSSPHYDLSAWLRGGERYPEGATLMFRDGNSSRPLVASFYATADANVSFDGTKVLFAGKKSSDDHWQIWEVAVSGRKAAQLTSCTDDCIRPFYLPDDRIVYARKLDGRFQIEAAPLAGGETLRLTYAPGNAVPTDVLRDGRILFEAGYPIGSDGSAELYTVYPDGSGVESYRCDHGNNRHSGKQMASGDIVFANDHGVGRFTSALAHEVQVKLPSGEFAGDAIEISDGKWVTSWRANSQTRYSLQEWNLATNTLSTLLAETGNDLVQPQLVSPRIVPNRFPSALHEWTGANVLCLNTYTSKLKIADGTVSTVNLYTQNSDSKVELLGHASVEGDGSFFLHVPSDQPLQIELLDKAGKTLQREHGWFWMRRGEQRVCVGCHAGPERAPENAVPQVLVKSTEPADMTPHVSSPKGGR